MRLVTIRSATVIASLKLSGPLAASRTSGTILRVTNNAPLSNRIAVDKTGGSTLIIVTNALLYSRPYHLHGVPRLTSVRHVNRILATLNIDVHHGKSTLSLSPDSVSSAGTPCSLIDHLQTDFFIVKPLLTQVKMTHIPLPNNYTVNTHPIRLRIQKLRTVNTSIRVSRNAIGTCVPNDNGQLGKTGVCLSCPDIKTARALVVTTALTSNRAVVRGTTRRPRMASLTGFYQTVKTGVQNTNAGAVAVINIPDLRAASCNVVPSHVRTKAFLMTTTVAHSRVDLSPVVPRRLATMVTGLRRINNRIIMSNPDQIHCVPNSIVTPISVRAKPFPKFPASVRTRFVTLVTLYSNGDLVARAIFRGHLHRITRLGHVNTSVHLGNGYTVVGNIRHLSNTPILTASLQTSTTLILTNLTTRNAAIVRKLRRLSHNCSGLRNGLHNLKTEVAHGINSPTLTLPR